MSENPNETSSEEREKYVKLRDNFHKKRDGLIAQVQEHKKVIEHNKAQIDGLEREISDSRPVIEGCEDRNMLCKSCDIYSMKYLGATPNPDKEHWYKCVICGHKDYHT